jgi:Trypsin-like peptidase domain
MDHPVRARVAEIMVARVGSTGEERTRGSGYLVSPGWVLTAHHVVKDAVSVGVWLGAPPDLVSEAGLGVDPGRVLAVPAADLALLPVGGQADHPRVEPALLGRLDRDPGPAVPVAAAGCPRFKLRPAPDRPGVVLRELDYAIGSIAALSDAKTGRFAFAVDVPPGPDPEPNEHSPWEGMSGAAVWASGRLVGVVGQHHPREGPATLTVCPVEKLFGAASEDQLQAWRAALPQLPATAGDLREATPPTVRKIEVARARRAAEALSPRVLLGRGAELAALEEFTGSEVRWRWIQGDAFAGKTALLAWFALHPPERVDVAACFLRRAGGANTGEYALDVLNRQLALLADQRDYRPPPFPSEQVGDFADLLEEAARATHERDRMLVVLVDGLDEYDPMTTGLDLADWLPGDRTLPDQAMLVAASRARADVRLPPRHPLLSYVQHIPASEVATEIQYAARAELKHVWQAPSGFAYRLVCCLAIADGGLTASELRTLLKRRGHDSDVGEIEAQLSTSLGRSLMRIPDPDVSSAPDVNSAPRVFVFAHDTLLAEARLRIDDDDLTAYEGLLDGWADEYCQRDWPVDTPRYLLRPYTRGLARRARESSIAQSRRRPAEADRLATIAADGARHDRMAERTLGDAAALDEIADAQRLYLAQPESDLARFVLLAIERERLTLRNQALPPGLPALWVRLGEPHRGQELAGSLISPGDRAKALAEMAGALAEADQREEAEQAAQDAEEATRGITDPRERAPALAALAAALVTAGRFELAEQTARSIADLWQQARALAGLAAALATAGQVNEAKRVALSIRDPGDHTRQLATLATVLADVGQLDESAIAARRALRAARATWWSGSATALAELGSALGRAGQLDLAERVARSIKDAPQQVKALAAVAVFGQPDQAAQALRDAEQTARNIKIPKQQAEALVEVVHALAAVGRPEEAARAALDIKDPWHQAAALSSVAAALANAGQPGLAAQAARDAEQAARTISDAPRRAEALTALASAIAVGLPDQARQLARDAERASRSISDPERAEMLAVGLSVALSAVGQVDEAQRAARIITRPPYQLEPLAALAVALATAGRQDQAEQFARDAERAARSTWAQAELLTSLTTDLATGLPDQAERIARSLSKPTEQAKALAALAIALAPSQPDRAELIARSIANPAEQAKALAALAAARFATGERDEGDRIARDAEETADNIVDMSDKANALAELVIALGTSKPTEAELLARSISNPRVRAETLAGLAAKLADVGDLEQAERIDRSIVYPRVHADALAALAATLVAAGQLEDAERVAADALRAARNMAYRHAQAAALATLAAIQFAYGRQQEAIDIARDAERAEKGAGAHPRLAAMLATIGEIDEAERIARSTDPSQQTEALAGLATTLVTIGELDRAEQIAHGLTDSSRKAGVLLQVASHCERTNPHDWVTRAHHICGLVLATSSWYLAFPLLGKLDPQSLVTASDALLAWLA